jgi:endonuclease YncB( thermonuclease family)
MNKIALALLPVALSAGVATSVWSEVWSFSPDTTKPIVGQARVIDGDTIAIGTVHVRLEGIDAPETDQKCKDGQRRDYLCGIAASKALRSLIGKGDVSCQPTGKDRYGRVLGVCSNANGADMNAELVRTGLAVAFRRYSMRYTNVENGAKAAKVGLWAGTFEHPGCFRAARDGRVCKDVI